MNNKEILRGQTDFSASQTSEESFGVTLLCANFCDVTTASLKNSDDLFHLCQLINRQLASYENDSQISMDIARLYIGSYFCDQYFCALDDAFFKYVDEFCQTCGIKATLVLPIFAQSTLQTGINRIYTLLAKYPALFDEVTVNDYGMANRLTPLCTEFNMCLNWGRLLNREQRDPRYTETSYGARTCALDAAAIASLKQQFPLGIIEFDPFAPIIDISPLAGAAPFALHLPHCFMSTGHICEVASAPYPPELSFRANMPCSQECCRSFSVTISEGAPTDRPCYLIKSGRTVFFENPTCRIEGGYAPARIIWSPEMFAFSLPEDTLFEQDTVNETDTISVFPSSFVPVSPSEEDLWA